MKVRIELDPSMDEPEILIRAPRLTPELTQLQERILEQKVAPLAFYKDRSEYFLNVASILFFETDGEKIFGHTKDEAYEVKHKLYELEELLPIAFCRISKSTIVNAKQKSLFLEPARSISTRPISRSTYLDATINS